MKIKKWRNKMKKRTSIRTESDLYTYIGAAGAGIIFMKDFSESLAIIKEFEKEMNSK